MSYVPGSTIRKKFKVCNGTLQKWANAGKIEFVKTPGGRRRYDEKSFENLFGSQKNAERSRVIYARVSSSDQTEDLERQIAFLKSKYPNGECVSDIGSGLDFDRDGFKALFKRVLLGSIDQIVVVSKDRLCSFSFKLFESICRHQGTEIVVLQKGAENEHDLGQDLLSIVNYYVAKNSGQRAALYHHQLKENLSTAGKKNSVISNFGPNANFVEDDGRSQINLESSAFV